MATPLKSAGWTNRLYERMHALVEGDPLPGGAVDDVGAGADEGSLEHRAEQAQDAVHLAKLALAVGAVLDPGEELGQDGEVEDERGREERVLARVRDVQIVAATPVRQTSKKLESAT